MQQQLTGLTGLALVRLLTPLAGADTRASRQTITDRLSQWLSWTDAIALSAALDGPVPPARADAVLDADALQAECSALRTSLARSLADDRALGTGIHAASDFASYRRHYLNRQQTMEVAIAAQRARLRDALAAGPQPQMARLAAIDRVMEQALGAQEHNLLATTVPPLLDRHFRQRRAEHEAAQATGAQADAGTAHPAPRPEADGAWQARFRRDLLAVLTAELDLRFQPLDALLAALRKPLPS